MHMCKSWLFVTPNSSEPLGLYTRRLAKNLTLKGLTRPDPEGLGHPDPEGQGHPDPEGPTHPDPQCLGPWAILIKRAWAWGSSAVRFSIQKL
ncbi:unnamed protein product [Boreogadus saida]